MSDTITIDDGYGKEFEIPVNVAESFIDEFGHDGPERGSSEGTHADGFVLFDDGFDSDDDVYVRDLSGRKILLSYEKFYDDVETATSSGKTVEFEDRDGSVVVLNADADFEINWNVWEGNAGNHHIVYYNKEDRVDTSLSGSTRKGQPEEYDYGWNFINITTETDDK